MPEKRALGAKSQGVAVLLVLQSKNSAAGLRSCGAAVERKQVKVGGGRENVKSERLRLRLRLRRRSRLEVRGLRRNDK